MKKVLIAALIAVAACGARSSLLGEEIDAGDLPLDGSAPDAAERSCLPECAIGHLCCRGGCDGPAVPLPSDCCRCLDGEVSSAECQDGKCGE